MNLQHYQQFELTNGLTLVCAPMPAVRSVSMGLFVKVGSRYEQNDLAGVSHFLEHMLFKGSENWPTALDIANEIEGRGGYFNASTGYEFTSYWIKIGAGHWRQSLSLLADMMQRPLLDAEEMEKERGVILDEICMYRDVPEDLVSLLSNEALWGDNPLGREIAGEVETVSMLSADDLRNFHARSYRPEVSVLTIAGAIDVDEIRAAVKAEFGAWQAEGNPPILVSAPALEAKPRYRIQIRPSEQAHLQIAVPGLPRTHPDRYALGLLNSLLGEGMTSRLWQRLREELGLAYNIGSFINMYVDSGVVGVYGGCDARRLFETLDGTMAVWSSMQEHLAPEEDLRRLKDYARGRLELSSEDSSSVASWWGRQIASEMEPLTLDQVLAEIEKTTAEDLQRLAQTLWQPQRLTLGYVGPLDSEQALVDWVRRGA